MKEVGIQLLVKGFDILVQPFNTCLDDNEVSALDIQKMAAIHGSCSASPVVLAGGSRELRQRLKQMRNDAEANVVQRRQMLMEKLSTGLLFGGYSWLVVQRMY